MKFAYQQTAQQLLERYETRETGLTEEEAQNRLSQYGPNTLTAEKPKSLFIVFCGQFRDLLVLILMVAAFISWISGSGESTFVIVAVIFLNAILGTVQYQKARKSLDSLKAMAAPRARILRGGAKVDVPASAIVPGDILLLEAGDVTAADGRIVQNFSLQANESSLTGESAAVEKQDAPLTQQLPLADRTNMAYAGSLITYGRALVLVTATGMHTEMGKIAAMMNNAQSRKTPLQISLDVFSKRLAAIILAICAAVFCLSIARRMPVLDALLFAVALAVAAIPEALGSIITIVQALGTRKMARENAILKDLKAVESLGCVSVVCSDKTGTLTQNKMTVEQVYINDTLLNPQDLNAKNPLHRLMLYDAVLTNDATLEEKPSQNDRAGGAANAPQLSGIGDPTEYCLLFMARKAGLDERVIRSQLPRLDELPFDSVRKLMSTTCRLDGKLLLLTKGACDEMLSRLSHIRTDSGIRPITEKDTARILGQNQLFSQQGMRVLSFAYRELTGDMPLSQEDETHLCFLGLAAITDPPRPESAEAVRQAKRAGIRPVMITGDHKTTAAAIARQIGILEGEQDIAITGAELDQMSEEDLAHKIEQISVYARVSPENKIRIVEAWQKKNHIVAMTGDGVNDAPALKKSDIGIAMGITGTEVSKDAASMILADDNFATIIKAVANGRNVYRNIQNAILFLLSGNAAGIFVVLYTSIAGLPIPFAPVQLLFINLLTDSLPAIAIGMEQAGYDLLTQKPRNPSEPILNARIYRRLLGQGLLLATATLTAYHIGLGDGNGVCASTMAFSTLAMARLFHGFNCRGDQTLFSLGLTKNPFSLIAFFTGTVLISGVLFLPPLSPFFAITSLTTAQTTAVFVLSFLPTLLIQLIRYFAK